jgi:hypothetical protein
MTFASRQTDFRIVSWSSNSSVNLSQSESNVLHRVVIDILNTSIHQKWKHSYKTAIRISSEPLLREEGAPNDMRPENLKWCLQEKVQLRTREREFDSPNVLNVTKTNRLRYAGHMIRRPEDLPQKALFRAKPIGRRNQGRQKSRWADGVNSDSLALGVRDWTHCAQDRQLWKDRLNQVLVVVPHK